MSKVAHPMDKEKGVGLWGRMLYFPRKHAMRRHDVYLKLLVSYLLHILIKYLALHF